MSKMKPIQIAYNSADEFIVALDSIINSSFCSPTKDWICYIFLRYNVAARMELKVDIRLSDQDGHVSIRYDDGIREQWVPLDLPELLSYVLDLDRPYCRLVCVEQARLWKLTAKNSTLERSYNSLSKKVVIGASKFPASGWEPRWKPSNFSPPLWFALQGKFTLRDFVKGRQNAFTKFIETHWIRLLSQCEQASLNVHWQLRRHQEGHDRCRCPGHELTSMLAPPSMVEPPPFEYYKNHVAEAVVEEIKSHIDPRILQFMRPYLRRDENIKRYGSKAEIADWYTPESPEGRWRNVSGFKALAAIADRLVRAFEHIKNDPQVMSAARAQFAEECGSLESKIEAQRVSSLETKNSVLDDDISLRAQHSLFICPY